jgi:autotransporter-associated beta strand protein
LGIAWHTQAQLGTNGWNFKMTNFVIGAWAGPSIAEAEIKAYAAANFNTVMVGRYMSCEGRIGGYYTDPEQVALGLDLSQKYGLGAFIDCYTFNNHPWGGLPVSSGGGHHPYNLEEFQWVHARFGQHPALVGYLLGDDQGSVDGRMASIAAFMRNNCPQLFPWVSGFCTGPTLYYNGVPSSSQEIYPTLDGLNLGGDWNVSMYCKDYWHYSRSLQSYGLPFWPMPNICSSDSLNRFPAYASMAYGAKGVWYFTYTMGAMQQYGPFWTDAAVQAAQTPQYAVGKEMNRRLASWSSWVMDRNSPGLFGTLPTRYGGLAAPATNKLVQAASDRLLIGILTKPGATPVAMVVNGLASNVNAALPARAVTIQFHPQVTGVNILENGVSTHTNGNVVTITLDPGSGQLLELQGNQLDQLSTTAAIYSAALPGLAWDANAASAGAQDGGGTWDTSSPNWYAGGTNLAWNNSLYQTPLSAVFGAGTGAAGVITVSGTNSVDTLIFNPAASGNYTLTNGTLDMQMGPVIQANADASIYSALLVGEFALTKSGPALLTLAGANTFGGSLNLSQGALQLNNPGAGSGTISLGDAATGNSPVALLANAAGAIFSSAITVTTNGTGLATIGGNQNALTLSGSVTLNRATTFGGTALAGYAFSGQISGSPGTLTIDGPRVTLSPSAQNTFTGTVVINAGRVLQLSSGYALSAANAVTVNGTLRATPGAGNSVTIGSLNGGGAVDANSGGGNYLATLNLGGDNANGTFSGSISNGSAGDTLALAKIGSGVQTLTGANTYTGNTTVQAGRLAVAGAAAFASSAQIAVANGATFDVSGLAAPFTLGASQTLGGSGVVTGSVAVSGALLAPGLGGTPGTLQFKNNLALTNATLALELSTNTTPGAALNDLIQLAGGTLTLAGTNRIALNFLNGAPAGTYTLIQGAGAILGGAASFVLANPIRPDWSVAFDTTSVPGSVRMIIAGAATPLVWRGTNGILWNLALTNWSRASAADRFWNNDLVVFDDTAATNLVSLTTNVAPASVLFSNSALNYTLSGSAITSGSLTKRGSGSLTLAGTSTYPGATVLSQGTLQLNQGGAAGAGLLVLGDAATGTNDVQLKINSPSMANSVMVTNQGTGAATISYTAASGGLTASLGNLGFARATTFEAPNLAGYMILNSALSGAGTLTVGSTAGQRLIFLSPSPAFAGDIVISGGGVFEPRNNVSANQVTVNAGAYLDVDYNLTVNALNGAGTVRNYFTSGILTVGAGNGSGTFSGTLGASLSGLTKTGAGTQTLAGPGIACSGVTTVAAGTLQLVETPPVAGPSVTVQSGATLVWSNSADSTFAPLLAGGGQFIKAGAGSLSLGGTAHSGAIVVNGGTLAISSNLGPSSLLAVNSGGTLSGSGRIFSPVAINNGGVLQVAAPTPLTLPSLSLAGGATALTLQGDLTGVPGNVLVTNLNGFSVNGSVTINVAGALPMALPAAYTLVSYAGTRAGAGNFVMGTLPGKMAGYITDTGSAIQLVITNLDPNSTWWSGSPSNNWDLSGSLVWRRAADGQPVAFTNGAAALFDDRAANFLVNVTTDVMPSSVTVNAANNCTFQGASVQAASSFLKSGAGRLTLLNSNTAPAAALWGGTIQLGNGGTNGWLSFDGPLSMTNNATLAILCPDDLTLTNDLLGAGGVFKGGTNRLTLAGSGAYSGGTVISGGSLQFNSAAVSPVSLGDANTGSNSVQLILGSSVADTGSDAPVAVTASGNGLATLKVADIGTAFSGAGTITLNRAATIDGSAITSSYYQSRRVLSGAGALTYSGAAGKRFIVVPASASDGFTGDITVAGGLFEPRNTFTATNGNNWFVSAGAEVRTDAGLSVAALNGLGTVQAVNFGPSTLTVGLGNASGTFAGVVRDAGQVLSVLKLGAGTQTFSGANAYTGGTIVSQGTLLLRGGAFENGMLHGTATVNSNATLRLDCAGVFPTRSTDSLLVNGGGALEVTNATPSISPYVGTISLSSADGAAAVVRSSDASPLRFGRQNSGLLASAGPVPNIYGAGILLVSGGATTMTVSPAAGNTLTIAGLVQDLSGYGGLPVAITGAGTTVLNAPNTYSGPTTVSNGVLLVNNTTGSGTGTGPVSVAPNGILGGIGTVSGAVVVNGAISPGASVGALATGAETWGGGGRYICELNATNAAGSDRLNILGSLDVQATAASPFTLKLVSLTSANAPGGVTNFNKFASCSWTIATASAGISNFDTNKVSVDTSAFANDFSGGRFGVSVSGNSLLLSYIAAPAPPKFTGIVLVGNGGGMRLTGSGIPGQAYVLQGATNLMSPIAWIPLVTNAADANGLVQFTDFNATNYLQRFYRMSTP